MKVLLLVCCILLPQAAHAQDRSLEILELGVYDLQAGSQQLDDSFDHEDADRLGLYALLGIGGLEERRQEQLDFFLVVFDADDEDRRRPLLKTKHNERYGNGEFAIEFDEFMDADAWLGDCDFVAELEVSMKGARSIRQEFEFSIDGPRMPTVRFDEIRIFSWERGPNFPDLEPGEEFVIDITVSVEDNETGLDPRLRLLAVMEDEMWTMDPEDPYMSSGPHWSEAWLRGVSGQWQVYARGQMPQHFENPYDYYHDYRIYAFVSFGENPQREMDYLSETLTDPDNGELRESSYPNDRLIQILPAGHWNIRQLSFPEQELEGTAGT